MAAVRDRMGSPDQVVRRSNDRLQVVDKDHTIATEHEISEAALIVCQLAFSLAWFSTCLQRWVPVLPLGSGSSTDTIIMSVRNTLTPVKFICLLCLYVLSSCVLIKRLAGIIVADAIVTVACVSGVIILQACRLAIWARGIAMSPFRDRDFEDAEGCENMLVELLPEDQEGTLRRRRLRWVRAEKSSGKMVKGVQSAS